MSSVLRNIPSVNELLDSPPLQRLIERANRTVVVSGVRDFLENLRGEVQAATADIHVPTAVEMAEKIAEWIQREEEPPLRPVINATGILLHTGLGRAPLADEAIRALVEKSGVPYLPMSMAKGLLPDTHPQSAGPARSLVLKEADVVMLIGARLNWLLSHGKGRTWGDAPKRFIHVDIEPKEMDSNT